MAVKVQYKPMGMTAPKPKLAMQPTPKVPPAPVVKPPMKGPTLPPPIERRPPAPTPNDRPKVNYNPAPKPIVAGPPPTSPKPTSDRVPTPAPTRPPPGPLNPGPVKPPVNPTQAKVNKIRRHETTAERIARLKAMKKAGNRNPKLDARIDALKTRKKAGEKKPKDKPGEKKTPVQLDDKPDTYPDAAHKARNRNTSEKLAEMAPPRGMDTIFYDNFEGDKQNKTAENQKQKLAKNEADKTKTPTQPTATKNNQNKDNNDTRQDEDLADRRARLQAQLAKLKPTDPKYAQLQARIKNLTKRIKKGDTKGRNKNQPGTPKRPFRTHEVTYKPLGYGGTLRI